MAVVAPVRDSRLVGYVTTSLALLTAALVLGRPVLVAGALPFATAVLLGTSMRRPIEIEGRFAASTMTPLEGDEVEITVEVPRPPGVTTHLHLALLPAWTVEEPDDLHVIAPADGSTAVLHARIRPIWWGRLAPGELSVTHRGPGGLVMWEHVAKLPVSFRVLPPPERVRELLPPPASHALIGAHSSRVVGDGFDFAELRPYQAGDRLRDVNWPATARYGDPHVNRRHPERNGEVVLLVDTFADASGGHSEVLQVALARAARAAWSICRLHLNAHDRVGLVARGRVSRSVPLGGGDRARYRLLEALLDLGGHVATGRAEGIPVGQLRVPPAALVIALTTLVDPRIVGDLTALKAGGRSVAVVVIDIVDVLPPVVDQADDIARRLFRLRLDQQRERLVAEGIPVTIWGDGGSLSHVIASLRHLQHARLVRR